ncbi:hypothetical protein HPB51_026673 [Rhipicephalus microplus]|uniref:Uncharacterized protein n=1 Tax=Rhipicephalus microplus TaxID=6941 RepID=A0A9J6D2G6_RHIMP|nr:uncharacterized protein LOC119182882 [Rhipicephalus microplus]KAH7986411.1 hypothetical protein HPB51_026673 [Rhipicephalus microplus]
MTGEVTGEPVIFARSSSSDCVALCASRLSQKCARATAARAQRGGKIVPSRPSGNDDASSIGGCSEGSSRIDESPKPARPLASGHLQGSAETSVRSLEDDSSVTNVDDSSSIVVPATELRDNSQNPADHTFKTGARYRRNSCSSGEDPLSEESVDGAELTEARPANETPSSTTCLAQSSEPPAPVPIQGQLELLLRNPDNTDTPRSSEMDSQSPSATQGYGGNEATGCIVAYPDASTYSMTPDSHLQDSSYASTSTDGRANPGGTERYEDEPSASSAISHDRSPAASGSSSPGTQQPRRITWGKAKRYPGSETVSELEDERSADLTSADEGLPQKAGRHDARSRQACSQGADVRR